MCSPRTPWLHLPPLQEALISSPRPADTHSSIILGDVKTPAPAPPLPAAAGSCKGPVNGPWTGLFCFLGFGVLLLPVLLKSQLFLHSASDPVNFELSQVAGMEELTFSVTRFTCGCCVLLDLPFRVEAQGQGQETWALELEGLVWGGGGVPPLPFEAL